MTSAISNSDVCLLEACFPLTIKLERTYSSCEQTASKTDEYILRSMGLLVDLIFCIPNLLSYIGSMLTKRMLSEIIIQDNSKSSASQKTSLLTRIRQKKDAILNSQTLQRTTMVASWAWTGLVLLPWAVITLPHKILDTVIPDLIPFKSLFIKIPSALLAYHLYHKIENVPYIGSAVHTIVPLAGAAIASVAAPLMSYVAQET
jgi:hypothetical protein